MNTASISHDPGEEYIERRLRPRLDWYDKQAVHNKRCYTVFHLSLLICSALTPLLVTSHLLRGLERLPEIAGAALEYSSLVTAIGVAFAAAMLESFRFDEQWLRYRLTWEALQRELWLYQSAVANYKDADRNSLFVENAEKIMSEEASAWVEVAKAKRHQLRHP